MDLISQIGAYLAPIVSGLALKFPILATVLGVMAIMRAVNKPLFALLHAYVDATATTTDNAELDKVETSKVYKAICFALDYAFSIKLPK